MSAVTKIVLIVIVVVVGGVGVFLAVWDIPPPSRQIEKEIPGERLGR